MAEMSLEQKKALAIAAARLRMQQDSPAYTGQFLPLSRDAQGKVGFDSNAGIVGSLKDAFMLPGDAMAGKVDPSSQEGIGRAFNAAQWMTPMNPGVRAGDMAIPGDKMRPLADPRVAAPSADELYQAGSEGYKAMRDTGVDYAPSSVQGLASTIRNQLDQDGILKELAPKTHRILRSLENPPEGAVAVPITSLHAARKAFQGAARDFTNPTEQSAGSRVVQGLDEFIQNPPEGGVMAGPADQAASLLRDANSNWAAGKRGDLLAGKEEAADLRAAAANSGQNVGNSIRQRIADLLLRPKESTGFTEGELSSLEKVTKGTPTQNATRYAGNLLGGGGGLGAAVTSMGVGLPVAASTGNPLMGAVGLAAPVIGAAAKKTSNALTRKALDKVSEDTRKRSALYERMMKEAPKKLPSAQKQAAVEAMIRAYLMGPMSMTPEQKSAARGEISF